MSADEPGGAGDAFLAAGLSPRPGDRSITNEEFWTLPSFRTLARTVDLDEFPGSTVVRRFEPGDVVFKEGEYGRTAFFLLTLKDVRHLGLQPELAADGPGPDSDALVVTLSAGPEEKHQTGEITEGDWFSEMTATAHYPRSGTVSARRRCFALEVLSNIFKGLMLNEQARERLGARYRERWIERAVGSSPTLGRLGTAARAALVGAAREVRLEHRSALFDEHDRSDEVYLVQSGVLEVVSGATWLVHPDEILDWTSLGARMTREAEPRPFLRLIRERLPGPVLGALRSEAEIRRAGESGRAQIIDALNALIRDRTLADSASALAAARPEGLPDPEGWTEAQVRAFNRLLLGEAAAGALALAKGSRGAPWLLGIGGEGELIGIIEAPSGERRRISCVAEGAVTLLAWPRATFLEVLSSDADAAAWLAGAVEARRASLDRALAAPVESLGMAGPLEELRVLQGNNLMAIDLDRCTHCGDCAQACADTHDGVPRLLHNGPKLGRLSLPRNCRVCHDMTCMIGCPVGSIRLGDASALIIEDWCIGCSLCAENCPFDAIAMYDFSEGGSVKSVGQKATACDLCSSLGGGPPACAVACPHEALIRFNPRDHFFPPGHAPYLKEPDPAREAFVAFARAVAEVSGLRLPSPGDEAEPGSDAGPTPVPGEPPREPAAPGPGPRRRSRATEDEAYSSDTVTVHFPAPMALPYQRFCQEREPSRRWELLVRALEAAVKYLVILGASDLLDGLARDGAGGATVRGLPDHEAFDLWRRPAPLSLGHWVAALRETARTLADRPDRFFPRFPEVCRPGGHLDVNLLGAILKERNAVVHSSGGIVPGPEEAHDRIAAVRPLLEALYREVRFVRSYPLGFVTAARREADRGAFVYRVHSGMGAQVSSRREAYTVVTESSLPLDVPLVAEPDGPRLLPLWPLLLQRSSALSQRPTLYSFESIPRRGDFLTRVRAASVEYGEPWESVLHDEPATDHTWLFERLRGRRSLNRVPEGVDLARILLPSTRGDLVGARLGPYSLIAEIGHGGSGRIYEARDEAGNLVAVKVIETLEAERALDRFERELAALKAAEGHPNIIQCFGSGLAVIEGRDYHYYAMELARGGDLGSWLEARRADLAKAPWDDGPTRAAVIDRFRAVAGAVAHLHKLGVIHRDLKPSNVLVMDDGTLRLSDFGLAKDLEPSAAPGADLTSTGAMLGTPSYMPPEQAHGFGVERPADVYALGILLAELATGQRPERDPRLPSGSTLSRWQPLNSLPKSFRELINRCTDVDPTQRYPDARAVLEQFARRVEGSSPGPVP